MTSKIATTTSSPRRPYHHGNLHAELIQCGLAILEANDGGNLSLRDLARRTGVTANAVYRHFADKESLQVAIAAEGFRRLAAAQAVAVGAQTEPRAALRLAGRAYVRFAIRNPALFHLMFSRFTATHRSAELLEAYLAPEQALRGFVLAALYPNVRERVVTAAVVHAWALVHGLSNLALDSQLATMSDSLDRLIDAVLEQASRALPSQRVTVGRRRSKSDPSPKRDRKRDLL